MKLIAAVSENWGIGNKNKLLFSIPADMKFFRETTKDSVVIMGRRTLESFPGKKPLKNRINIMLTSHSDYEADGVFICHTINDAVRLANKYKKEIFIIGGDMIYREFLPYCDTALITKVHAVAEADAFFPNLDNLPEWKCVNTSGITEDNGYMFEFTEYQKKSE